MGAEAATVMWAVMGAGVACSHTSHTRSRVANAGEWALKTAAPRERDLAAPRE